METIIIVVIISIFLISVIIVEILNHFSNDYFIDIDRTNQMPIIGGNISNIPKEILEIINVRWPQVGVVSNRLFQDVPLDKFYYSEKTDGLHVNVLIHDHTLYNITHINDIKEIKSNEDMLFDGTAILDTELYNDVYHIFDVYYLNGENLNNKFFLERLETIKPQLEYLGSDFVLKEFKPIPNIKFLIDYMKYDISPTTNENIDGVILQRIDKPYLQVKNENNVFKMKPRSLMTVDFLMKYIPEKDEYKLYLIGNKYDYFNNLKLFPQRQEMIYDVDGNTYKRIEITKKENNASFPRNLYILFDSPFIPNLGVYKNISTWNKSGYSRRAINEINHNISELSILPDKYNDKIVEMSLTLDDKWVPLKIRDDKLNPNGYRIGLDNVSLIFDPIKEEKDIYFQKDLTTESETQTIIHNINNVYRKYIAEKYINPIGKFATVLDICGGRGGDLNNLFYNGCTNFFVIDSDTTALKQYVNRSYNIRNIKYENLNKNWKRPFTSHQPLNINALNHVLGTNYKDVITDIQSRYEWRGNAKIVLMNFAIHYLCDSELKLRKLAEFVKSILDDTGIFIFTYYDGDYIYDNRKIGPFEIEIIKETNQYTIAKLPVPTFQSGDDIYREEPLVHKRLFKNIDKYLKLKEDVILYDMTNSYINKIKGYETVIDYYKLVHLRVYTK